MSVFKTLQLKLACITSRLEVQEEENVISATTNLHHRCLTDMTAPYLSSLYCTQICSVGIGRLSTHRLAWLHFIRDTPTMI